jgi:hypothetical protein
MSGCTKRQAWLNISRGSHSLFVFTLLVFLKASALPQKLRQLRHVGRNPPRLVFREQLGSRSPAGLILEIDIGELLAVVIAHDKAGGLLLDRPGRREAALCHWKKAPPG